MVEEIRLAHPHLRSGMRGTPTLPEVCDVCFREHGHDEYCLNGMSMRIAELEAALAERDKRIAELENMLQCEANLASNKGEEARELREALLAIRDVSICDCDEDADDDEVRDYCPYCIAHKILEAGR